MFFIEFVSKELKHSYLLQNPIKIWKPYKGLSLLNSNLKNENIYQVPELDLAFHKLIPYPAYVQKEHFKN